MANSRGFLKRMRLKEPGTNGGERMDYGEVARVAYTLYEQRGRMDGRDLDDWLKAETIVKQTSRGQSAVIV